MANEAIAVRDLVHERAITMGLPLGWTVYVRCRLLRISGWNWGRARRIALDWIILNPTRKLRSCAIRF